MGNWDTATPAGTDLISLGDDNIREMKAAIEEALSTEAIFPGSAPSTAPVFKWTGKRGNTAGRPASPSTGEIYFNTQLFQMEYYDGASWTAYDLVPALGISAAKLAADAVTTAKILDANVTTAKIADLNVTTGKIADLAIIAGKIAALAVTDAKINDVAASKITGILPVANGGTGVSAIQFKISTYVGTGLANNNAPHGLGTTPTVFFIFRVSGSGTSSPILWHSGMTAGTSRSFDGVALGSTYVSSVNGTNVVLGTEVTVNENGTTFCLMAFL